MDMEFHPTRREVVFSRHQVSTVSSSLTLRELPTREAGGPALRANGVLTQPASPAAISSDHPQDHLDPPAPPAH